MGREPLSLTPSSQVHYRLPKPTQRTFAMKLRLPSKTKLHGSPAVSGGRERLRPNAEMVVSFAGGSWQPAYCPETQLARQANLLTEARIKFW